MVKPKKVVAPQPKEDEIKLPEKMVSLPTLDDENVASSANSKPGGDVQNKEQLLDNIVESSLGETASNEGFFHNKHKLNSLE